MRGWCLVLLCVAYWLIDWSAVRVWRGPATLWAHAARATPLSVRATGNHLRQEFVAGKDVRGR